MSTETRSQLAYFQKHGVGPTFLLYAPSLLQALLDLHSVSIGDFKLLVYIKDNTDKIEFAMQVSAIPLHFSIDKISK